MRALLFALTIAALALPAQADHCSVYARDPELTTPATTISLSDGSVGGENPGIYYIDNDACQPGCALSVWVYEETNGYEGLQRGDEFGEPGCEWLVPDTIIF